MIDRKFRIPRIWSNKELAKFAELFYGRVVNVSGWRDQDKQGRTYRDYFSNAAEYILTNYKSEARGYQGNLDNEIFLDLSLPIDAALYDQFDVVFTHTVLEHIFEVDVAFENLCRMTRDIVILVVPFLQEQHGSYGDYWRFSPQAVDRLFEKNGLKTLYINCNDYRNASIYVFAIGGKIPEKWKAIVDHQNNRYAYIYDTDIGTKVIRNSFLRNMALLVNRFFK